MSINMGNDEFILHIRKRFPLCTISNDQLGKRIWQWLNENDELAEITVHDLPCHWGNSADITSEISLPKTATQFRFSRQTLPALYDFLANLASN